MEGEIWGVGAPTGPGPSTVKYGGNTSCLEIRSDEGDWIIFDAGTGLRALGDSLDLSKKHEINLMISHPHWDHINGFPFFTPIYIPGNKVTVYGPSTFELRWKALARADGNSYFPVRTAVLSAVLALPRADGGIIASASSPCVQNCSTTGYLPGLRVSFRGMVLSISATTSPIITSSRQ